MLKFSRVIFLTTAFTAGSALGAEVVSMPKQICDQFQIKRCENFIKEVDAFTSVDLNSDGIKEIIFAYDGGSCGEQHYVFSYKDKHWLQIANWCGMDGGGYKVLSSKHNKFLDIDTGLGVIKFDGKKYPNTTSKN